jgi:hypothetical protein
VSVIVGCVHGCVEVVVVVLVVWIVHHHSEVLQRLVVVVVVGIVRQNGKSLFGFRVSDFDV